MRQDNVARGPVRWGGYDSTLLVSVLVLLLIGLVAVYSATVWVGASADEPDPSYYFRRQVVWVGLGIIAMVVTSQIPYRLWRRVALPLFAGTVILLVGVLFLPERYGSSRFLLGNRVQPSEVAKFALVVYAATWLTSHQEHLGLLEYGLIPFGVIVGFLAGLVALQPDIGTALLLGGIGFSLFFIAGARMRHVSLGVTAGAITAALLIAFSPHARERVLELVHVWLNSSAKGWSQLRIALSLLKEGGVLGRGPGALDTWLFGIHNDFILSAVGHAFGLAGITVVIVLFGVLAYRGYLIAARAPDPFASLLAAGVTTWFVLQALVNMGVAVALLPPTGVTLPFVSYGGSSMVMNLAATGMLLNISQTTPARNKRYADTGIGRGDGRTRLSRPQRA